MYLSSVIYIITDYNNPEIFFGRYTDSERFNAINSDTTMGFIDGSNGESTNIRIQAALNSIYFDQSGKKFTFLIGNNEETNFNELKYTNYPLLPGSTLSYSYYILFFNEHGVSGMNRINCDLSNLSNIWLEYPFNL